MNYCEITENLKVPRKPLSLWQGFIGDIESLKGNIFNWQLNLNTIANILVCLTFSSGICNSSYAAGFAVLEQSVSGMGSAYSGLSAGGEDISSQFNNPAGLSEYQGTEIVTGGHLIIPEIKFTVDQSSDVSNRSLSGSSGSNAAEVVMIPNLYLATDLPGPFRFGLGITVPFGLGVKYDQQWQGRYEAIDSELKTIDINPAIAYAFNDKLSLGFGLSAQYIDVELSNAIDFGSLCLGQLSAAACSSVGLTPQSADGNVELQADGWSWGYNLGVLYKPIPSVRLGIAYRSRVRHKLKGNARFQVPKKAQLLTSTGAFKDTTIESESYMPASLSVGAIYEAEDKWAMQFNFTWTQWNRLDRLLIDFENPIQPTTKLNLDFKNTIRTSLGFIYHLTPDWSIKTGFVFDESPVKNSGSRSFRIPDSDRYWLTAGLSYRPNASFKFNIAYAHVFIKDSRIVHEDAFGHSIQGQFESKIDILSAELQWSY